MKNKNPSANVQTSQIKFLESMDRINRAIQSTNDLNEMMFRVMDETLEIFNCDRAYFLYPLDPKSDYWSIPMERTRPEFPGVGITGQHIPMSDEVSSALKRCLENEGPVEEYLSGPYTIPKSMEENYLVKSFIGTPILPKIGQPWQFGLHQCTYERFWTDHEKRIFQEIGRRLGDGLTTLLMFRELQTALSVAEHSNAVLIKKKVSIDLPLQYATENISRISGYSSHYLINNKIPFSSLINPEDRERVKAEISNAIASNSSELMQEYSIQTKSGDSHWVEERQTLIRNTMGEVTEVESILIDKTEKKRAEAALASSQNLHRYLLDTLTQKVFYKDRNLVFITCNKAFAEGMGLIPKMVVGKSDYDLCPKNTADKYRHDDQEIMKAGVTWDKEESHNHDGKIFWSRTVKTPMRDEAGNITGVLGISWDVTKEKEAAQALERSESHLSEAQRVAHIGSWELDIETDSLTLSQETRRIFEIDKKNGSKSFNDLLDAIHLEDRAIVDKALKNHLKNRKPLGITFRLSLNDNKIKYIHFRSETSYKGTKAIRSFGTVQDITSQKEADQALIQEKEAKALATDSLRQSLVDTIQALGNMVEKRDPYTAGHQRKVAELCLAIGKKLSLDENQLEGLHLGAIIHDIGKIYVPAEILNRPGKLTESEFDIIKSHVQVGYDIVKDINFPWPVKTMIHQHHERLDGSGYPNNTKERDQIIESKILMVADVMEAMTSHRPYRPSLGLEYALSEIKKYRGKKFDKSVVDACVDLFQSKEFTFS